MTQASAQDTGHHPTRNGLALLALGIVFGDIGTSPLYALQVALGASSSHMALDLRVLGLLSLIFWALLFTVSFKYATIVLRADNQGQGGILALLSLVKANRYTRGVRLPALVLLGILGAAFLMGDGTITPAISVLSAYEGLKVLAPGFGPLVLPLTTFTILVLFCIQRRGTASIGTFFGPVMLAWFLTIAAIGLYQVVQHPGIVAAFNPIYGVRLLLHSPIDAAIGILGAVFLALTGGEAMYADMGHVGAPAIRRAWIGAVLPALFLNYLGQGAAVLAHPAIIDNPFYKSAPAWALVPLVLLAAAATVIASQALISGVFSLTQQAIQMGIMPRMRITQTSGHEEGQIYVGAVNWILMVATIAVVWGFRSSDALAAAYGIAVSGTMLITTILLYRVMIETWRWSHITALGLTVVFIGIDAMFLGANFLKILEGGWLPLVIGAVMTFIMVSWRAGTIEVRAELQKNSMPLDDFMGTLERKQVVRVPGIAVMLTRVTDGVSLMFRHHACMSNALHERVVLCTVETTHKPREHGPQRISVEDMGHGFTRVILKCGFMQRPNVEGAMRKVLGPCAQHVHYFIGHEILRRRASGSCLCFVSWMSFSLFSKLAGRRSDYFRLPNHKVEQVALQIDI